jgi:dTDP-4-dehydrorhamnose 3,5-epimerase-like enzyme
MIVDEKARLSVKPVVTIEIEGEEDLVVHFAEVSKLDAFDFLGLKSRSEQLKILLGKIERIEGLHFEDGTAAGPEYAINLDGSVLLQIVEGYNKQFAEAFAPKQASATGNERAIN